MNDKCDVRIICFTAIVMYQTMPGKYLLNTICMYMWGAYNGSSILIFSIVGVFNLTNY